MHPSPDLTAEPPARLTEDEHAVLYKRLVAAIQDAGLCASTVHREGDTYMWRFGPHTARLASGIFRAARKS
ncbi:hypothetical protein ACGFW5_03725 [Streptomyces sp. NPDC048416]|uniref:hypothetical protein n=1 Tax=Streptomyces sp. NPDC048416 TaxID=3365546 RepID=UPI00371724DD